MMHASYGFEGESKRAKIGLENWKVPFLKGCNYESCCQFI